MSLYEALLNLVGSPPAGYDIIVWVVAAVFLLYLLCSAFSIIASVINFVGGR